MLPVAVSTFQEVAWREAFDGIWASASLLHVPRVELPAVLRRLRDALTPGGLWHMSFKLPGQPENGRALHLEA